MAKAKGLIGRKLGMTQVFDAETRNAIPVTVLEVGPCVVTQVKTMEKDGYTGVQIGFAQQKIQRVKKPQAGHFKAAGTGAFHVLREFALPGEEVKSGDVLTVDMFAQGSRVDVAGITKGRGFQGVIKRFGQNRGDKTHGGHCYRLPGASGNKTYPGEIWKGKQFPGQMGNVRRTSQNLTVVKKDIEKNLLYVRGAVPGTKNGIVLITEAVKA